MVGNASGDCRCRGLRGRLSHRITPRCPPPCQLFGISELFGRHWCRRVDPLLAEQQREAADQIVIMGFGFGIVDEAEVAEVFGDESW